MLQDREAGPINPVGVVQIDLDKERKGLRDTAEASRVGEAESHGFVRLTNWDAEALAGLVAPGTPVLSSSDAAAAVAGARLRSKAPSR